ncbi:hypothetical protein [Flavobacterium sp. M31R6]|uniref:hypothetical protein n=1 Tax=Flavobacterium sp. M31R6 TaxID=2739062 RepID=UPI001567D81C|nr:hypothetical protein [Flavobacterium sp. M31R6]QKJ62296.1 hypothetical protein HQN62_03805 [Flavobacterium sp. M31R6]
MDNIIINKGNIVNHGFTLNYRSAIILSAINHVFQNKSISPFECITDENGVWFGCSYSQIITEVPILKLNKVTCLKIVNNLIDLGFIERHINNAKLSKTFLKPSRNFKLYFENNKNEVVIDQNKTYFFDGRLSPLHWFLLDAIDKNQKNKFNSEFVFINETEVLKSLFGVINSKPTFVKIFKDLVNFGYIEKTKNFVTGKIFYYKAGAKYLEYNELKNKERGF